MMNADSSGSCRKRKHCECGFELTGLSTYHQAEHKRSKRHRQFLGSTSCLRRMDSFFQKIGAVPSSTHSDSDCEYFYKFSLRSAAKRNARSPCNNIPVKCTLCDQIHWKYNMATHYEDRAMNVQACLHSFKSPERSAHKFCRLASFKRPRCKSAPNLTDHFDSIACC